VLQDCGSGFIFRKSAKMKWLLLIFFFPFKSFSQVKVVNSLLIDSTIHQLIKWQDNPLKLSGIKVNSKYVMTVDGKTIVPNKSGVFVVKPVSLGKADVRIMDGARVVFASTFIVDSMGGLYARVGRIRDSSISKQLFLSQPALTTYWHAENVRCPFIVFGFNFQLISTNGEYRQSQYVQGRGLYPSQIEEVRKASSGTVLLFHDIMVVASSSRVIRVPDIRITIR
jgi:hypothetical protein